MLISQNIEPKEELKVWYAGHYAKRLGLHLLEVPPEPLKKQEELDMALRERRKTRSCKIYWKIFAHRHKYYKF